MKKLIVKLMGVLLCCLIVGQAAWSAPVGVNDMRISIDGNKNRIVLDLTDITDYQHQLLTNPDRLVLDIQNAQLAKPLNQALLAHSMVSSIKSSKNKNTLRIVFNLKNKITVKFFTLPPIGKYNNRLIVDLTKVDDSVAVKQSPTVAPVKTQPVTAKPSQPAPDKTKQKITKPTKITASQPAQAKITFNTSSTASPNVTAAQPAVVLPSNTKGRDVVIVIDPGHGGKDPGASGPLGYHEKNVVLAISKALQQDINQQPGFHAVLTRNSDYFIPLRQRLAIARKYKADMFVAIHADAFKNADAYGASVFALSERGATSEAARWLAEKENYSELIGGGDLPDQDNLLRSVLIDLSQNHTIGVSLEIGRQVLRGLSRITHLHYTRVEQAAFVVLKSPDIPSLLVETGYISNPHQEQQLINPQYQQQIAQSIMQGIKMYFVIHPPRDSLLANRKVLLHYKVVKGDTLPSIAKHYQIKLADLRHYNKLTSDKLKVGQTLTIPSSYGGTNSAYPSLADIQ